MPHDTSTNARSEGQLSRLKPFRSPSLMLSDSRSNSPANVLPLGFHQDQVHPTEIAAVLATHAEPPSGEATFPSRLREPSPGRHRPCQVVATVTRQAITLKPDRALIAHSLQGVQHVAHVVRTAVEGLDQAVPLRALSRRRRHR